MGHSYTFKIVLDTPHKSFTLGDHVKGQVVLDLTKSMTVKDIVVSIYGIAESANYRWVSQYNAITKRHERRKLSQTIRYDLFSYAVKVFPPPNLQQIGLADDYTLADGHYSYPFELRFPSGPVEAKTSQRASFSNSYMDASYLLMPTIGSNTLSNSGTSTIALPPAFDLYKEDDDKARVRYLVEAKVDRKGFLKSDFGDIQPLRFSPPLESVMCSFSPLLEVDQFIPNFDGANSKLAFSIEKEKRREGRGFFSRMFASRSLKVPFEAVLEFKQSNAVQYPQGPTSRVLHQGDILSDVVDVRLYTPFSKDAIQRTLMQDHGKKSDTAASPLARIIIKEINVSFVQLVSYQGIQEETARRDVRVGSRSYKNEFEFSDFEEVEHWSPQLFKSVKSEHASLVESRKAHMLEVPSEMLSIPLDTDAQSFTAPNIRCDIRLKITIVLTTTDANPEVCRISCDTPIILLPQRKPRLSIGENYAPPPMAPPSVTRNSVSEKPVQEDSLPSYSEAK